jgi:hypothetical protein
VGSQQRRIIPPPPKLNPIKPNPINTNNVDTLLRPFLPSLAKQQKNPQQQQGNVEKGQERQHQQQVMITKSEFIL